MIRVLSVLLLCGQIYPAIATSWEFDRPIDVSTASRKGVFHHLESAGRKNIAVSGNTVAVVWEDNHRGGNQVYLATKNIDSAVFSRPRQVSTGRSAYEPTIVIVSPGVFMVAWEQDGEVWLRAADINLLNPPQRLAGVGAAQVSLAARDGSIAVVWAQRHERFSYIQVAPLKFNGMDNPIGVGRIRMVDVKPPRADQAYPSVVLTSKGWSIAWEDRRFGHTVLLYAHSRNGNTFALPKILNEQPPRMSTIYGKGAGVARVALTAFGAQDVVATWLDKRDFTAGYDVYADFSRDGGRRFGPNQKVQDEFGNAISQWHPAIASDRNGGVVVTWDDDRDETSDIWLSWPAAQGWSADLALPGGSGPGIQRSPTLVFDDKGRLHIAWVDQKGNDGPTRVRYALGRRIP
jgi:hypothetical protein